MGLKDADSSSHRGPGRTKGAGLRFSAILTYDAACVSRLCLQIVVSKRARMPTKSYFVGGHVSLVLLPLLAVVLHDNASGREHLEHVHNLFCDAPRQAQQRHT